MLTVNGDNRLAFYACKDIKPGEELFFNYNYKDEVARLARQHEPQERRSTKTQICEEDFQMLKNVL